MASTLPGGRRSLAQRRKLEEVDGWRIVRKLGSGGMGVVYLAEKPQGIVSSEILHRRVALKTFNPGLDRKRIAREIRAQSNFNHPNLIHYLGHGTTRGVLYLLMNYVQGKDSGQLVRTEEKDAAMPLPVAEACAIAVEVAKGLSHIHKAGFVHRDVKPANIMVSDEGSVVLGDLGLTDISGGQDGGGTPAFVAPEQARRDQTDYRADIYSLGCSLYYLLSGRTPFEKGSEPWEVKQNHPADGTATTASTASIATPLVELDPSLPADLSEGVARMMKHDREKRPASCAEVIDLLKPWANEADLQRLFKSRQHGLETVVHNLTADMLPEAAIERRSWLLFAGLGTGGLLAALIASRGFGPNRNAAAPIPPIEVQEIPGEPRVDNQVALNLEKAVFRGKAKDRATIETGPDFLKFKPIPGGRREMLLPEDLKFDTHSLHIQLLPRMSKGDCGAFIEGAFGRIELGFKADPNPGKFWPFASKLRTENAPPQSFHSAQAPLEIDWQHGFGLSLRLKDGELQSAQVAGIHIDLPVESVTHIGFYAENTACDVRNIEFKLQKVGP